MYFVVNLLRHVVLSMTVHFIVSFRVVISNDNISFQLSDDHIKFCLSVSYKFETLSIRGIFGF